MRLRYAAVAQAEADDILAYIAGDNPAAATAVAAVIKAAVARLRSFPGTGTATEKANVMS
jgi:plasmid stabilization system protein ParE